MFSTPVVAVHGWVWCAYCGRYGGPSIRDSELIRSRSRQVLLSSFLASSNSLSLVSDHGERVIIEQLSPAPNENNVRLSTRVFTITVYECVLRCCDVLRMDVVAPRSELARSRSLQVLSSSILASSNSLALVSDHGIGILQACNAAGAWSFVITKIKTKCTRESKDYTTIAF